MSASTKVKRALALALAGGSLAIGVPAAIAATSDAAPAATNDAAPPAFIQDGEGQAAPNAEDCPERDGSGAGSGSGSGGGSGYGDQGAADTEQAL